MEHSFWRARWDQRKLGFHLSDVNPNLVSHWSSLDVPPGARALVPLCGKSLDMRWLAQQGHQVVGVEFVESAVREYFEEQGLNATRCLGDGFVSYAEGAVELIVSDFFKLRRAHVGPFAAVYDRAALVALDEERRAQYVERLAELCPSGTKVLLVTFDHDFGGGPPFSVPGQQVERLFAGAFELGLANSKDILEQEPRFKERGATYMLEQVWLGERC